MIVLDHIHEIEAASEDGDGLCSEHGFTVLVECDFGQGACNVASHGKELVIAQTLIDQVTEDAKCSVELCVGAIRDDSEDCGEKGWPLLGEVVDGNFANGIAGEEALVTRRTGWPRSRTGMNAPSSRLDLSIIFLAQSNVEERLLDLCPRLVGDGDLRLIALVLGRPLGLNEEAKGADGGLTNGDIDGIVRCNVDEGERIGRIRLRALELELGLHAMLARELGVGEELHELVLHGGRMLGEVMHNGKVATANRVESRPRLSSKREPGQTRRREVVGCYLALEVRKWRPVESSRR